ncbi:hypothetical protein GCM10009759_01260 [Kitasatospora saccharophila]|uniref:Gram-positive cocci surface proteins LPxTG domain-containing protein n=1 Tax=Kitasatospora saccharophila TaxID=407973 RepID=A0ABN2W4X7_9ACTN
MKVDYESSTGEAETNVTERQAPGAGRRLAAAALCAATVLGAAALPLAAAAPTAPRAATGTPLVDETFTGASADSGFVATDGACLTGAAEVPFLPVAEPRALTGCPGGGAVGPVPPNAAAPHGYLRMTDAGNDRAAAVLYERPLPANEGIRVTFEQWQYGGDTTKPSPADGIAFFLVDGAASLTRPGAFGGSLGYAQKLPDDNPANAFLPGVEGGYLGVGLDVLGNYFGDWEHRGDGCATRSPAGTAFRAPAPGANMVTLRGPGEGTSGYCFLGATTGNTGTTGPWPSTLPGQLHGPATAADLPPGTTPAQAEAALEPSRRTVTVTVTPGPDPQIEVDVDFGAGPVRVLSQPAPQPVPATYKFGFASSTGAFTDVHLLRHVTARSAAPLPRLNLVKQIDRAHPLPDPVTAGTVVPYQFVVTNGGDTEIRDLAVTDPTVGPVSCPSTVLAVDATVTCTAPYTVTEADVRRGYLTNVAVAHGDSDGGPVESPEARQELPLNDDYGLLLEKQVDDARVYRPGQRATYTYTVTNTTGREVTDLAVTDDRLTGVRCAATTLTPRDTPGAVTTCTASYTVTAADAEAGSVRNTATATGRTTERTVSSPPDEEVIAVEPELGGTESPGPSASASPSGEPTGSPSPSSPEPSGSPEPPPVPSASASASASVPGPGPGGALPGTGSAPVLPLLAAAGLVLAGVVTLRLARRR